jgi:hypothetical protein
MTSQSDSESASWRNEYAARVLNGLPSNMVLEYASVVSLSPCRRGSRVESSVAVRRFRRACRTPTCIISLRSACCSWWCEEIAGNLMATG